MKTIDITTMKAAYDFASKKVYNKQYVLPALGCNYNLDDVLSAVVGHELNERWESLYDISDELVVIAHMADQLYWLTEDNWSWNDNGIAELFQKAEDLHVFAQEIRMEWVHQDVKSFTYPSSLVYERPNYLNRAMHRRHVETIFRICEFFELVGEESQKEKMSA